MKLSEITKEVLEQTLTDKLIDSKKEIIGYLALDMYSAVVSIIDDENIRKALGYGIRTYDKTKADFRYEGYLLFTVEFHKYVMRKEPSYYSKNRNVYGYKTVEVIWPGKNKTLEEAINSVKNIIDENNAKEEKNKQKLKDLFILAKQSGLIDTFQDFKRLLGYYENNSYKLNDIFKEV